MGARKDKPLGENGFVGGERSQGADAAFSLSGRSAELIGELTEGSLSDRESRRYRIKTPTTPPGTPA